MRIYSLLFAIIVLSLNASASNTCQTTIDESENFCKPFISFQKMFADGSVKTSEELAQNKFVTEEMLCHQLGTMQERTSNFINLLFSSKSPCKKEIESDLMRNSSEITQSITGYCGFTPAGHEYIEKGDRKALIEKLSQLRNHLELWNKFKED